ncbi:MAG: TAXI family TRAP transporter solute-binding subunit [Deltaproteobacteria bacterium]|jgi:TRAP transporter TAXI family solute receptor|nr:TAXI family TRAP transporter solute-binding subunit [Deltaproteobacteria bacterium]
MKNAPFRKGSLAFLALCLLMAFPAFGPSQARGEQFITLGTGGIQGVYYPVGGAICRLVNKDRATHGLRCTVESTGASVYNVNAIRSGDMDMGIAQSDTQHYAATGTGSEQFIKAGPDPKLRALFSLHGETFTLVARDDAKIKVFEDLAGKRMNVGDPGSGNRSTLELLMTEYGWTDAVFSLAADLKASEMASALCDNKIDAYVYVVGHPNASIKEASVTCESHLVPLTGSKVDSFLKHYPFYIEDIIPGGMYTGTPKDVKTFGPLATLVTSADLSEEAAYQVVKAVFSNLDEFKKLHPVLEKLNAKEMVRGNSAPFHPGALRYFKEAGLL